MDLSQFIPESVTWSAVLLAIAALLGGWIVSHFARRSVIALMRRAPTVSETVASFAARFVAYSILIFAVGVALALLGANVQPLLAMVILIGVILVLVLRGISDNFAAGVLIQTRQTLKVGDELQAEGPDGLVVGIVTEMNARSVLLLTRDGRTVHIPNAKLLSDPIVNDSTHGVRRSEVQVRVELTGRPRGGPSRGFRVG